VNLTDFNDLHVAQGLEAVRSQVLQAINKAVQTVNGNSPHPSTDRQRVKANITAPAPVPVPAPAGKRTAAPDDDLNLDYQPMPLPEPVKRPLFPLDALGPVLGPAAHRLAYHVQVPAGMAGQSVLAAAALCCQHLVNVQRGSYGAGPVSLFCLTVAESGDRKSSVDRLALKPVREFERRRVEQSGAEEAQHRAAMKAWKIQKEGIEKAATRKADKGGMSAEDQRQLTQQLIELEATRPAAPSRSNITIEEPTAEGIWRHYREGEPSAGLFSDEGIGFFGGHGMTEESRNRMIATLSHLWDGKPLTRTRAAEGESGQLISRRLSAHLMMQPVISDKILSDPLLMGQGFIPRFLICREESLAGTRFISGRDASESPEDDPAIREYWNRLDSLLAQEPSVDKATGGLALTTLPITGEAFTLWRTLFDGIESESGQDGGLSSIRAFASKAPENAARIAAILATVEGRDDIGPEHIQQAGELIAYYLESMRTGTEEAQQDAEQREARELLDWMAKHDGTLTAHDFKKLPTHMRSAKKARELVTLLVEAGHAAVIQTNAHSLKPSVWRLRGAASAD